jgi:glycosyltransferase involved in cell wall biosynthesis
MTSDQNNVLYAPPTVRDGRLYRGVVATDHPDALLSEAVREKWVILFLTHGAMPPPYHPEVDLYQTDPGFRDRAPHPQVYVTARDFSDPARFRPIGISKEFDVVYNACWVRVKRPEMMIAALRYAVDRGRPISCLWFGYHWHPEGAEIESKIVASAREQRLPVVFEPTNFDPQVVNLRYNRARVAVLCSGTEAGPRVMSEAMLAGLPYVTTRDTFGGSPEFINDQNGRLSDPTAESLAESIWHALDHPDSYRPRAWALENMCLTAGLRRIGQALDRLAERKGWLINRELLGFAEIDWQARRRRVQEADAACPLPIAGLGTG